MTRLMLEVNGRKLNGRQRRLVEKAFGNMKLSPSEMVDVWRYAAIAVENLEQKGMPPQVIRPVMCSGDDETIFQHYMLIKLICEARAQEQLYLLKKHHQGARV